MRLALLLLILLAGCTVNLRDALLPDGNEAEQIVSPSGRFRAQLWRCCDIYDFISGFVVRDAQTGIGYQQRLKDVRGLHFLAGGITFEWTPNEHYLLIVTDNRVTSHGCSELLVYSGDGSQLVFTSATTTSVCRIHPDAEGGMSVSAICPNDDIVYDGYRLTPATGGVVPAGAC